MLWGEGPHLTWLYKVLTFHNPNLISIFRHLGHLSKESVQVQGLYELFITCLFFMVKGCLPHAQPPSWRTAPCRLSAVAYSIYSQLPSIASIKNILYRALIHDVTKKHITSIIPEPLQLNCMYTYHLCGKREHATGTMNIRLEHKPDRNLRQTPLFLELY
jgi:hypothetical protein